MLPRLDYPGVGPEHSFLKDMGRAEYHSITDEEALEGMCLLLHIGALWMADGNGNQESEWGVWY